LPYELLEHPLVLPVGVVEVHQAVHAVLLAHLGIARHRGPARARVLADRHRRGQHALLGGLEALPQVGLVLLDDVLGQRQGAAGPAHDALRRQLGGEHRARLGRAADDRERLLVGNGDGVGLGGLGVVAGAGAGVPLDRHLAPVGLEHAVVDVEVALDGGGLGRGVDVDPGRRGGGGRQRVQSRIRLVVDHLDLVGGHARRRGATVVALERLDARRGVHRGQHDRAALGVAVRPEVDVLAEQLGLGGRHGPRADQLLLGRHGPAAPARARVAAVVVIAAPTPEHHDGPGDQRHDGRDRPVAAERALPGRRLPGG
jgi:hypothetical protein